MSKVVVFGLGYVGLVIAARAAEVGYRVIGAEVDPIKVASLNAGVSYIEDVTDEDLANISTHFRAVNVRDEPWELENFDVAIIAVPTPMRDGMPDLSYVESAARMIAPYLRRDATVVLESTTYPGTTEGMLADILWEGSGLTTGEFCLGFSPERIDPGNREKTFINTPKVVSGIGTKALLSIRSFYDTIVERTIPVSTPRVAEITKIYENTFAAVNIALLNEMTMICRALSIDVEEMITAGQTKGHSMMPLWRPGPGVGGHCLPIDPLYLSWLSRNFLGIPFEFADLADKINKGMSTFTVNRSQTLLSERGVNLDGASVLVMGLAYKANTSDIRESPAIDVVRELEEVGAKVTVCDPHVKSWIGNPTLDPDDTDGMRDFDMVLIVTHHDGYDYEALARNSRLILDTRHRMRPADNVEYL